MLSSGINIEYRQQIKLDSGPQKATILFHECQALHLSLHLKTWALGFNIRLTPRLSNIHKLDGLPGKCHLIPCFFMLFLALYTGPFSASQKFCRGQRKSQESACCTGLHFLGMESQYPHKSQAQWGVGLICHPSADETKIDRSLDFTSHSI